MVNYMSALMSGACILFLFWSITHLVRKLIIKDENNITTGQLITIMGSGLVGANCENRLAVSMKKGAPGG